MIILVNSNKIVTQMKTFWTVVTSIGLRVTFNKVRIMVLKSIKLRRATIGTQLLAGIGLLTASYLTTDSGWTEELLNSAIHSEQPAVNLVLQNMKAGLSC